MNPLEQCASQLRAARRVTILTGAGVSAASGVPTFRGAEGLWRRFRPEDLATPQAFRRDPYLVWEWYAWRREKIAGCQPNAAHEVIARWSSWRDQEAGREHAAARPQVRVITQNVDDLHLRAGTRDLVRLHGSIWELSCAAECGAPAWRDERVPLPVLPPPCPRCGGMARPAVVWFGESLVAADIDAAMEAAACDLFITAGTSAVVYPAAGLVHEAKRRGAFTVEINPEATPASDLVDVTIRGGAEMVLPRIEALL
jgi:NAD-dependent deacetylase